MLCSSMPSPNSRASTPCCTMPIATCPASCSLCSPRAVRCPSWLSSGVQSSHSPSVPSACSRQSPLTAWHPCVPPCHVAPCVPPQVGVTNFLASTPAFFLIDRYGHRPVLTWGALGMAVAMLIEAALAYTMDEDDPVTKISQPPLSASPWNPTPSAYNLWDPTDRAPPH